MHSQEEAVVADRSVAYSACGASVPAESTTILVCQGNFSAKAYHSTESL